MNGTEHRFDDKLTHLSALKATKVSATREFALESAGFAVAEGVSMATALGVVAIADQLFPSVVNGAADVLAKVVIEPNLDFIEKTINRVCKLEECKRDESIPREERAHSLAKTGVVFTASWAASMAAKLATRRVLNHSFGIQDHSGWDNKWAPTRKEWIILAADEPVHYGSLILANTAAASTTDTFIRSTQGVLEKCGVPKDKAHELASYTMIWEMPNFMGLLAGIGAIYATHKYPSTFGIKPHI